MQKPVATIASDERVAKANGGNLRSALAAALLLLPVRKSSLPEQGPWVQLPGVRSLAAFVSSRLPPNPSGALLRARAPQNHLRCAPTRAPPRLLWLASRPRPRLPPPHPSPPAHGLLAPRTLLPSPPALQASPTPGMSACPSRRTPRRWTGSPKGQRRRSGRCTRGPSPTWSAPRPGCRRSPGGSASRRTAARRSGGRFFGCSPSVRPARLASRLSSLLCWCLLRRPLDSIERWG